jgi:hypothetical protein
MLGPSLQKTKVFKNVENETRKIFGGGWVAEYQFYVLCGPVSSD